MRISDWSSDVCSSDLAQQRGQLAKQRTERASHGQVGFVLLLDRPHGQSLAVHPQLQRQRWRLQRQFHAPAVERAQRVVGVRIERDGVVEGRSEEHTSELQSLMRISYAVFCLKKKKNTKKTKNN